MRKVLIEYIKDIFRFSRKKFILTIVLMVIDGITGGVGILMLVPLLSLTGIAGSRALTIPFVDQLGNALDGFDNSTQLVIILLVYLILVIMKAVVGRQVSVLINEIVQGYTKYLRNLMYARIVRAEWSCIAGKKKANITNTFTNEIARISSGTIMFLKLLSQIIIAVFQISVALLLSFPLTVVVLLCGAVLFIVMGKTFLEARKLGGTLRSINQELITGILEQLNGVKEVKSYGIEEAQKESFKETTRKSCEYSRRFTELTANSVMYYKIGAAVLISLIFYFAVTFLKVETTAMLIIVFVFARLWPIFTSLQSCIQNVFMMIPSYISLKDQLRTFDVNAEKMEPGENFSGKRMIKHSIRFRDVCFRYNSSDDFELQKINFEIPVKSMTAFVGKSGSGKSTIVDLLLGLLKPSGGCIMADDQIIDRKNMVRWRQCIGYVPQDPFLFNGTVRENLVRFNPDASDDEMTKALQLSAAWDFIEKLPDGIDTVVGDSGIRLSGGERQRIVLARALLRKPEILVLDEATSALDNENEYKIQHAVEQLSDELTVIVIAHRLSTIQNADKIIYLENGKIIEQGSFQDIRNQESF